MENRLRKLLGFAGVAVVIYSVTVLAFVISSPDLRLRWLVSDPQRDHRDSGGVQFWTIEGLEVKGQLPKDGDILLEVARQPVHTYLDLSEVMLTLYNPPEYPGDSNLLYEGSDPSELPRDSLPPIIEIHNGPRMVEIVFQSMSEDDRRIHRSWVTLQSLPLFEIFPTVIWYILQLGIFAVAALAFWNRPFDRSTQMFYLLCMCGLGAFVGGFHWWVIGSSLWLNVPFICMALLLPVVILHFFLVYPRPTRFFAKHRAVFLGSMYSIPIVAMLGIFGLFVYLEQSKLTGPPSSEQIRHLQNVLDLLVDGIWIYLILSGAYFVSSISTLIASFRRAGNRLERMQLTTMLVAACLASLPLAYSMYLAHYDRVGFVMGYARIPMFLASLVFQLAFVIGIIRYKLMLAGQFVPRGAIYYISSAGVTLVLGSILAVSALFALQYRITLSSFQNITIVALLMIAVLLMIWIRDRLQQAIDRRFYQEKYQLDKALQRMNRAVSQFADIESLTAMMFGICHDVLLVDQVALYLKSTRSPSSLTLSSSTGNFSIPDRIDVKEEFLKEVSEAGILQRVTAISREKLGTTQETLQRLGAQVVQILEMEQGIHGMLVLGEKRNKAPYAAEDFAFLQALGQMTNVALHSLKAQEEMVHLNEEMRLKIERISEQSRQISLLHSELHNLQSGGISAPVDSDGTTVLDRGKLKGNGPAIRHLLGMVPKVSQSESSVLIRGESGTGKELLAEILHNNSARRDRSLVKVHCAALSANLLESELFGHVKGAFTGAHQDKIGRFQAADGGTIFLDEIGDISLETQVKLLRVLQSSSFEPVGSTETHQVNVRLVTATHQNLEQLIAEGRFREDLYYRLNVISLTLPSLRERTEDILELSIHFLNQTTERLGKPPLLLSDEVLVFLEKYSWPGNIRQLQNVLERAAVLAESNVIEMSDLPAEILEPVPQFATSSKQQTESRSLRGQSVLSDRASKTTDQTVPSKEDEKEILQDALQKAGGNKARAARSLGIPRSTFHSKFKKYFG